MLLKFKTENTHCELTFKYVPLAQEHQNDGKVKAMCLKLPKNRAKSFKAEEKDISCIDWNKSLKFYPCPKFKLQSGQDFEFPFSVNTLKINHKCLFGKI